MTRSQAELGVIEGNLSEQRSIAHGRRRGAMLEKLLNQVEEQLRQLGGSIGDSTKETLEYFRPKDPFSWQTLFLLGLFSWGMAILSLERFELSADMVMPPVTWVMFTMGWIFITFAVGWSMVNQKVKVPFLNVTIKPAIWVTSALASAFAFQVWNPSTRAIAFVSWPIVFALFSAIPKFVIISENKYNVPNTAVRQDIVLTTLICFLLSSWIRLNFVVQDWGLTKYPALAAGDFSDSTFVVQLGAPPPVLNIAESTVNDTLAARPIPEVRSWLIRLSDYVPELSEEFRRQLESKNVDPRWELNVVADKIYDPALRLRVFPIVSASEAENEAPLRNPEEREEAETEDQMSPAERLQPRAARIGLERNCRILSQDEYEEEVGAEQSPDETETELEGDTPSSGNDSNAEEPSEPEPPVPPSQRGQSAAGDRSRMVCDRATMLVSRRGS